MKESETALNEVKAEVAKLEEEENQLQKEVVDVRHELEKLEGLVKSNQKKIKYWKKEVGKSGGAGQIQPEKDQVLEKGGRENWSNPTRKRSSTGKRR